MVLRDNNKTAICRRENKGLLAGMYEPPSMEGFHTAEEVTAYLAEHGFRTLRIQSLADAKHVFTHKEWHMKGYLVKVQELESGLSEESVDNAPGWLFVEPEETREKYPIPSAFAAYAKYLGNFK